MKFLALALLALPFGGQIAQALPVNDLAPESGHHALEPRQELTVQFDARNQLCGPRNVLFSSVQQRIAFDETVRLMRARLTIQTYPHQFRNDENVSLSPLCATGKLLGALREFPIMANGLPYGGGPPGAHRIVVQDAGPLIIFCGVITHEGASTPNGFIACRAAS